MARMWSIDYYGYLRLDTSQVHAGASPTRASVHAVGEPAGAAAGPTSAIRSHTVYVEKVTATRVASFGMSKSRGVVMDDNEPDLLTGYREISAFLGWKPRTVRYRAGRADIPMFRVGRVQCATKSALRLWLARQMAQAEAATRKAS